MKVRGLIVFILIFAIAIAGIFIAVNGVQMGEREVLPMRDSIKQGLDLRGGVFVVFEADTNATGQELDQLINQTIQVFRRRVDAMGLTEPMIVQEGDRRIRVELPGVEQVQDALEMIGKTAQLEFVTPDGELVLTGANVVSADPVYIDREPNPVVSLELDAEGTRNFADATGRYLGDVIFIILDDE
ncbi:MAG: protein translocase subunit SecD, partial [Bacillota bacterium]|nr:protein translocase subunit SecD [Bacillota bacterium]